MRSYFLILIFCAISGMASSATIQVPGDYSTIQAAIDAAAAGDIVLVAPGTYVENLNFQGKAITLKSSDGPKTTVIDGGSPTDPNYGSVVLFENNEGRDSVIQGFTLINGTGTFDPTYQFLGGGIRCKGASPTIVDNIITGNTAVYSGGINCYPDAAPLIQNNDISYNTASKLDGAIECWNNSDAVITGNRFEGNSAADIGAILIGLKSDVVLNDNVFIGNHCQKYAGAIMIIDQCDTVVSGNLFYDNTSTLEGGAIRVAVNSTMLLTNNMICNNTSYQGGAVSCAQGASMTSINNTICSNTATQNGGGLFCKQGCSMEIYNTILRNNSDVGGGVGKDLRLGSNATVTIDFCNIEGDETAVYLGPNSSLNWGANMIDADPLFVDEANGDWHLTYPSPCRDAGSDAITGIPGNDFEGDMRTAHGQADMGADEFFTHFYCTGDFTPGGSVEGKIIGLSGANPVGLFLGTQVLDPPLQHNWGDFYLDTPWWLIVLTPIPGDGVLTLPTTIPATPAGPYDVPLQALVDFELSNLFVLEVR